MKKRILAVILVVCAFLMCTAFSADQQKVYDYADLLTSSEESSLQQTLVEKAKECSLDLIVVTTSDTDGKSSMKYADDFYDDGKFGYEGTYGSGVLFLIDMDNRECYISTAGQAQKSITDSEVDTMLDKLLPLVSRKDYYSACTSFASYVVNYSQSGQSANNIDGHYDTDKGEYVTNVLKDNSAQSIAIRVGISAVIAAVIVGFMAFFSKTRKTVNAGTWKRSQPVMHRRDDYFVNTTVITRHIESNHGGPGGGGHSSTHMSGGGHSHGGGGRGF